MTDYVPPPRGVTTPPATCREYLGREFGYCDGAIQTTDVDGRGFCTEHAKERGF
jgi:hypothetical protein